MKPKRKGGSRLTRSEIIQVRLDPKLRFAAELAARHHRVTLSSYIEKAIAMALGQETVYPAPGLKRPISLSTVVQGTWDVEEADRFVLFANMCPILLNHDEGKLWKMIRETPDLWKDVKPRPATGYQRDPLDLEQFDFPRLRERWESLKEAVYGA